VGRVPDEARWWGDDEAEEVVEVLGAVLVFAIRNLGFFFVK
jgi:hypothetical protein